VGKRHQVVMYGPRSKSRSGKRISGYPVYIPGHVVERASVRRYKKLGGAAKDAHRRATRRGYSKKRYARRRMTANRKRASMRKNRRSSRRRSTRRNPKYVIANRRRRRRLRKNPLSAQGIMKDVIVPVAGGTAGFAAARFLSNGIANVEGIRNLLDEGMPASEAKNTKIAANVLGILATLGLSAKVALIKKHQGAIVTGMGLALTDRLLSKVTGPAAAYLSGMGEYVSQPLGEYVSQPLGAYVQDSGGMGEYVAQPLGGGMGDTLYAAAGMGDTLYAAAGMGTYAEGVDPADQSGVDGLMDVMEAAAGTMEAAAGMGMEYATAGLGEADSRLKQMYAQEQPPFASIQTPTDLAMPVTGSMPYARQIPDSLVTPEGRGFAGGIFSRSLYAGMS